MTEASDARATLPPTSDMPAHPEPDLIEGITAARRIIGAGEAAQSAMLATAYRQALAESTGRSEKRRELALRSAAAEMASALRRAPRGMLDRMAAAHALIARFPETQMAWSRGELLQAEARIIERHGSLIEDEARRRIYVAELLEAAATHTPGQLERLAERLSMEARGARTAEETHALARVERRVTISDAGHGMAWLSALLPVWQTQAIHDRLTEHAAGLRNADEHLAAIGEQGDLGRDERTFDQLRADSLADILLGARSQQLAQAHGGTAPEIRARVGVQIPWQALIGATDEPCELLGVGPITLEQAREIAADADRIERILTHPVTGVPVAVDTYRPSSAQERALIARDRTCRFPGCRRSAERSDIDHTVDWADGGTTSMGNLAHLCRAHHTLKHQSTWTVRHLGGGRLEWTSPAGRIYRDEPAAFGPLFEAEPPGRPEPPGECDPPPF